MRKGERIWLLPADPALAEAAAAYYVRNREFLRPFNPMREEAFYTAEYQRELLRQEKRIVGTQAVLPVLHLSAGADRPDHRSGGSEQCGVGRVLLLHPGI